MTTVRIEQQPIETTPSEVPDPDWTQRCSFGHDHRWADGVVSAVRLVVLAPATDAYPKTAELRCNETGEVITPRWCAPQHRTYAVGQRTILINDVGATEEELAEAVKRIAAEMKAV